MDPIRNSPTPGSPESSLSKYSESERKASAAVIGSDPDELTHHPAWSGYIPEKIIEEKLEGKQPMTFTLTKKDFPCYRLSYVRMEDRAISHLTFDRMEKGEWHYKNYQDSIAPSLEAIILKVLHWQKGMPTPIPFKMQ